MKKLILDYITKKIIGQLSDDLKLRKLTLLYFSDSHLGDKNDETKKVDDLLSVIVEHHIINRTLGRPKEYYDVFEDFMKTNRLSILEEIKNDYILDRKISLGEIGDKYGEKFLEENQGFVDFVKKEVDDWNQLD